jgi:hypothetical protein
MPLHEIAELPRKMRHQWWHHEGPGFPPEWTAYDAEWDDPSL